MTLESAMTWFKANRSEFSGQISFDEPLSRHTYYRIGGPASVYAVPKTQKDLSWLAEGIAATGIAYLILGLGSNVLVSDAGYRGLLIRATRINLELDRVDSESLRLRTGASVAVSSLLRRAAQEGWGGLEFLSGIPGSIGGVVTMNAGTHLGDTQSRVRKVEVVSLQVDPAHCCNRSCKKLEFDHQQLQFQYRKNLFLPRGALVWAVEWEVELKSPAEVKLIIDQTLQRRKSTQPTDYPSCGSVFKNPRSTEFSAWQVIDRLGLRGYQIGQARFSDKHSNFIINLGNAKATDVKDLIQLAKNRALEELGIELEEEVLWIE